MKNQIETHHIRLVMIVSSDIHIDPLSFIEETLRHGVTMIQLREKGEHALRGEELHDFAQKVLDVCKNYHVPMIVNDDYHLAETIQADGVHLGQDDFDYRRLSQYFSDKIVGLSVKNSAEFYRSDLTKVSYVSVGKVFGTDGEDPIGIKGLEKMHKLVGDFPTLATGGINGCNYRDCLNAGANGIGVMRGVTDSEDIEATIRQLLGKTEI